MSVVLSFLTVEAVSHMCLSFRFVPYGLAVIGSRAMILSCIWRIEVYDHNKHYLSRNLNLCVPYQTAHGHWVTYSAILSVDPYSHCQLHPPVQADPRHPPWATARPVWLTLLITSLSLGFRSQFETGLRKGNATNPALVSWPHQARDQKNEIIHTSNSREEDHLRAVW